MGSFYYDIVPHFWCLKYQRTVTDLIYNSWGTRKGSSAFSSLSTQKTFLSASWGSQLCYDVSDSFFFFLAQVLAFFLCERFWSSRSSYNQLWYCLFLLSWLQEIDRQLLWALALTLSLVRPLALLYSDDLFHMLSLIVVSSLRTHLSGFSSAWYGFSYFSGLDAAMLLAMMKMDWLLKR